MAISLDVTARRVSATAIWAWMPDWVLDVGDLPRPHPGSVLPHVGIRLYGSSQSASDTASEGIIAVGARSDGDDSGPPSYFVTGTVDSAHDFQTDPGSGATHAGLELVLSLGGCRFQAQVDGHGRDVAIGSHITVRGTFFVIAEYEWEDFGLVDTRTDWMVEETISQPDGDLLCRLALPAGR